MLTQHFLCSLWVSLCNIFGTVFFFFSLLVDAANSRKEIKIHAVPKEWEDSMHLCIHLNVSSVCIFTVIRLTASQSDADNL